MNAHLLIDAVVQQTVVFIADLATVGGVRAPLAHVARQVFVDLTNELHSRGVRKNVIADMFGMTLRTYHRRVREASESQTIAGESVWEAVLGYVREHEPVSGGEVLRRFQGDDPDVVAGVLGDLAQSGLVYRAGRGDGARYRIAREEDFSGDDGIRLVAEEHVVWLAVYRGSPATESEVSAYAHLGKDATRAALASLIQDGRVVKSHGPEGTTYRASRFEVPIGAPTGWEAAVLDHFQALVAAVVARLRMGSTSRAGADLVGGSTWSLDVWQGHPLAQEARGLLGEVRTRVEALRQRVDQHNASVQSTPPLERVVFYAGQHIRANHAASEGEAS